MQDYLVNHALTNVWCTPDQDMQSVVKPARITPVLGVFNVVDVLYRKLALPVAGERMHVYQIGQLHPLLMGLFPIQNTWEKISDACGLLNLVVDLYNGHGQQLPRTQSWYYVTQDRNLLLAVQNPARGPVNLKTQDLYVRVYSNEFFNSTRANQATDVVHVEGGLLRDSDEILALQTAFLTWSAKPGFTYAFCNGLRIEQIDLINVQPGDVAEFVYDSSIKQVYKFNISDLPTFESELDAKLKYLVHPPLPGNDLIDFHDDCDFYLNLPNQTGLRYKSVLYHRNAVNGDAVRMLTHRDYSIVTAYVNDLAVAQGWQPLALQLQVFVRKSGWQRPLVFDHNRIKELYKLPDAEIKRAMLSIDATVPNWQASVLEASAYSKIMRGQINEVTPLVVENAYGYNALSVLLANTPTAVETVNNQQQVTVPYGLQTRSTGYEYDAQGLLIDWHTHVLGGVYPVRNAAATLVEMISGDVSDRLDEVFGESVQIIDANANYRMYRCPIVQGVPNNVWEDVTDSGQYTISEGGRRLTWLIDPAAWYTMVRSDKTSLGYTLNLDASDGLLDFSLTCRQVRGGVLGTYVMQVPQGELDLWLNGRSLIEGLDYLVQFPKVVITTKEYLVDPVNQLQRIDVRFSGFCNADFSRDAIDDAGYVVYGQLSHNNRFDLRDDRVMRVVVDGALYHRSELLFTEDNPAVFPLDARNGAPYMIRDLVVPMQGITGQGTYVLRARSQSVDQAVSNYLSIKNPQPVQENPSAIGERYTLYSPLVNKILRDLERGIIDNAPLKVFYNDEYVRQVCQPYEWLLAFDPTQDDNAPQEQFVKIHPHNRTEVLDVDIYHYKFLSRVVALYCHGRVELSPFLRLKAI